MYWDTDLLGLGQDAFGRDGIYDELIILHDYPYLNNKLEFVFNETASDVMKAKVYVYIYIYMYMYMYVCTCVRVYTYVCIYIHIYIHT
jgi:hypothetical protein